MDICTHHSSRPYIKGTSLIREHVFRNLCIDLRINHQSVIHGFTQQTIDTKPSLSTFTVDKSYVLRGFILHGKRWNKSHICYLYLFNCLLCKTQLRTAEYIKNNSEIKLSQQFNTIDCIRVHN